LDLKQEIRLCYVVFVVNIHYPVTAATTQSNDVATSNDNDTVTDIQDLKATEMSFVKALSIQREMLKSNPRNADQVLLSVASTQCKTY
jgi:hypothetical protein